jgi:hypothetical protein
MPANFTMLAQNSYEDYVRQACACAMSIRVSNPDSKICLITNDTVQDKYKQLFTDIVEIPWGDKAKKSSWKVGNRWKIYHASPYENTIVLDTDMLVLDNISEWWNFLLKKELYYVNKVKTYKGEWFTSDYYRKSFRVHNLPNLYSGFHYYKKCDFAHEFYKWLEIVMNNWELFQGQFAGGKYFQKDCSVDVSSAIVAKILDCSEQITSKNEYPTFVHMKLYGQNWKSLITDRWQDRVGVYLNSDLQLKIGNFRQNGIFHYTEKDFLSNEILETYEKYLGI